MKYCGNCGQELRDDEHVCSRCKHEFIEFSFEAEQKNVEKKKKKRLVLSLVICLTVLLLGIAGLKILGVFDKIASDFKNGYEDVVNEITTKTTVPDQKTELQTQYETVSQVTTEQIKSIEILDLFDGLEKAREVLGSETQEEKIIDPYTKHTFKNVGVMCEYGTNNIYSITVKYDYENERNMYSVLGVDGNSNKTAWSNTFGDLVCEYFDSDGNPVFSYNAEYNGDAYSVEITASSEYPDKISVYRQITE